MGEVGGYDLHVYCDHPEASALTCGLKWSQGQGYGHTLAEARRHLRVQGWYVNPRKQSDGEGGAFVLCPVHRPTPPKGE